MHKVSLSNGFSHPISSSHNLHRERLELNHCEEELCRQCESRGCLSCFHLCWGVCAQRRKALFTVSGRYGHSGYTYLVLTAASLCTKQAMRVLTYLLKRSTGIPGTQPTGWNSRRSLLLYNLPASPQPCEVGTISVFPFHVGKLSHEAVN